MIAKTYTCTLLGIEAMPVEVEVDLSHGLQTLEVVFHLSGHSHIEPLRPDTPKIWDLQTTDGPDFDEIKGQSTPSEV